LQIDLDCDKNNVEVFHIPEPKHKEEIERFVRDYEPKKTREIDLEDVNNFKK